MTRRRRARFYLRGHLGCLGCSIPLLAAAVTVATVALALAGCSGSPSPVSPPSATTTQASPVATPSPAEPVTAAAARSAAETYFALYGAGQIAAVYPMIAPADRAFIPLAVWLDLHTACPNPSAGLTYTVSKPVLAGDVAVFSVGLAGAASALGSEQVTFTWTGGRWYYVPSDLAVYKNHDAAQAVAAAKAAGLC